MALSNMRNEPRRELIESGLGIVATILFLVIDYKAVHAFLPPLLNSSDRIQATIFCMFLGCFAVPLTVMLAHLTHWFGEVLCGWAAAIGYDPRPKDRWP